VTDERDNSGGRHDRDKRGRWRKGVSGNPAGPGTGSRNRATKAVEALLDGEGEALTRKAVELALEGDTTALRLCLERIAPPRKERPVEVELPRLETPDDAVEAQGRIANAVAAGDVTPGEGEALAKMVEAFARALEVRDLEARLQKVEERLETRR
jgi:hypothetical protein